MIIVGYPGIGKTDTAINDYDREYIDLESSLFRSDRSRDCFDIETYCRVAVDLNDRGFKVLVSSHNWVIRTLLESYPNRDIVICHPSKELKTEWVARLRNRYATTNFEKDKRALMHVLDHYDNDIEFMHNCGFPCIVIDSVNYLLKDLIDNFEEERCE